MYIEKKPKRRFSNKTILFMIIISVVVIVFITGLIMLLTRGKDIKDLLVKMPFKSSSDYLTTGNTIVYSDSDIIDCIDVSKKSVWKVKITSGLKYTSNDNMIAATGLDVIMVLKPNGDNLFSRHLNGTVKSVRLGKDKVAVYTDQTTGDKTLSYIIIFDLSGNDVYKIDVSGKYILDYGLDQQGGQLYVLELDTSGAAPISRITTYKPEAQSMTGVKELEDQLVERIVTSGGVIYTLGTNRLSEYTSLNATPKEILVYGWIPEDISIKADIRFVYIPSSESSRIDIARIIRMTGDEIKINLPPGVFKITDTGDKIYCFATNSIFVYTGDGRFFRSYDLPFSIDGVRKAMAGYVFLSASEDVYLLPLP
jgi:hypothetical protein